jgi:hypothetical protein
MVQMFVVSSVTLLASIRSFFLPTTQWARLPTVQPENARPPQALPRGQLAAGAAKRPARRRRYSTKTPTRRRRCQEASSPQALSRGPPAAGATARKRPPAAGAAGRPARHRRCQEARPPQALPRGPKQPTRRRCFREGRPPQALTAGHSVASPPQTAVPQRLLGALPRACQRS